MIVVGCPVCGDNVLAPSGVSTEANVRCPLCMEEFPLSAAFSELPPELIVLDQPAVSAAAPIMPIDTSGGESREAAGAAPAFQFEEGSAPVRPQVQVRQTATGAKPKNVIVEMLKVVLGGVLGLAIGQILLWRMPGDWPAHQRDPFDFGKKYGNVFPVSLLAPESVRDPGSVTDDWEYDSDNSDRPLNGSASTDADTGIDDNELTGIEPNTNVDDVGNTSIGGASATTSIGGGSASTNIGGGSASTNIGGGDATVPTTLPGIRFPPRVTGSKLDAAVQHSESAAAMWAKAEGDRAKERSALVASLQELAYAVTFIQPARSVPKDTVAKLREFLPQFAEPGFREAFYQGEQAPDDDDALAGEVVVGKVRQITLNGELFQTMLTLSSGVNLSILSVEDPRDRFTIGDQILMLGVWITNPSNQLAGHESLDGPALFGEFPIRLVSSVTDETPADTDSSTDADLTPPGTDPDSTVPDTTDADLTPPGTDPDTTAPGTTDGDLTPPGTDPDSTGPDATVPDATIPEPADPSGP